MFTITLCAFILTGLELLKTAIAKAGYTDKIKIGMDVAASGMIQHPSRIDFTFNVLWRKHPLDQHCIQEVTIVHLWELKAAGLVSHLGLNTDVTLHITISQVKEGLAKWSLEN